MRLLVSDANILIDMEAGGVPDLLYREEIEPGSPGLEAMGLKVMEVHGEHVRYAEQLNARHNPALPGGSGRKPSHHDYLALALARQESCALLTGDSLLRTVARKEHVEVMGSIGLLCAMVDHRLLTVDKAFAALGRMKQGRRWLPWSEAERQLNARR